MPRRECGHPGCKTNASYGVAGSKKPEFCAKHAKDGMVNVREKKCGHPGCNTRPSFGAAGSKKREFCAKHAEDGMVNVREKKCGHPGCTGPANYGLVGGDLEFCFQHKEYGMHTPRQVTDMSDEEREGKEFYGWLHRANAKYAEEIGAELRVAIEKLGGSINTFKLMLRRDPSVKTELQDSNNEELLQELLRLRGVEETLREDHERQERVRQQRPQQQRPETRAGTRAGTRRGGPAEGGASSGDLPPRRARGSQPPRSARQWTQAQTRHICDTIRWKRQLRERLGLRLEHTYLGAVTTMTDLMMLTEEVKELMKRVFSRKGKEGASGGLGRKRGGSEGGGGASKRRR